MVQGNSEIVLRQIEAANRRDLEAFVALASEDVEWEDSMFWSEPTRIYRGRAELREWLDRVLEPWDIGGEITSRRVFLDRDECLEAAGLRDATKRI